MLQLLWLSFQLVLKVVKVVAVVVVVVVADGIMMVFVMVCFCFGVSRLVETLSGDGDDGDDDGMRIFVSEREHGRSTTR